MTVIHHPVHHRVAAARPRTGISRRRLLAGLGAAGLLSACGRDDATTPNAPAARTVTGAFGPVTVPSDPRRVVTGYDTDTDYALVLGLTVVAAAGATGAGTGFPRYQPADRLKGVTALQTYPEVNYETFAAQRPDLILDEVSASDEARYKKMSEIAPTLCQPSTVAEDDWKATLRWYAEALQRPEPVQEAIRAYDEQAADLRGKLAARWAGATVAYVNPLEAGTFVVIQATNQTLQSLGKDCGMTLDPIVPATFEQRKDPYPTEKLEVLAGVDLIVLRVNPAADGSTRDRKLVSPIVASPLWARLPAVTRKQVFEIDGELFYPSPLTAKANLDWAQRMLLA